MREQTAKYLGYPTKAWENKEVQRLVRKFAHIVDGILIKALGCKSKTK